MLEWVTAEDGEKNKISDLNTLKVIFGLFNLHVKNKESDSFWINSAIDYFTGLTLHLFENATIAYEIHIVYTNSC